jgi:hypothetical protein
MMIDILGLVKNFKEFYSFMTLRSFTFLWTSFPVLVSPVPSRVVFSNQRIPQIFKLEKALNMLKHITNSHYKSCFPIHSSASLA